MTVTLHKLVAKARAPVEGPERDLLSKALANGLLKKRRLERYAYFEPKMPTGYPDLLVAYVSPGRTRPLKVRRQLTVTHLRLAQQIHHDRGTHLQRLADVLRLSKKNLEALTTDLSRAGLVRKRGGFITMCSMRQVFPVRHILAIECKVADWRRAMRQAVANTWFASESYILIPRTTSISTVKAECGRVGIGVIVFEDGKVHIEQSSRKTPLPASYGSWIVNEWVVGEVNQRATWM